MKTDREKHELKGLVKSVHIEKTVFEEQDGQAVERAWFIQTVIFNRGGQAVEEIHCDADGSKLWRIVKDYSDSGKPLASKIYGASDAPGGGTRYVYDEHNRLVAERRINPDGSETGSVTYVYDDEGGKTKIEEADFPAETGVVIGIEDTDSSILINADGAKRIETRYDERGAAIKVKVFNDNDALLSRMEIIRDARGNPLEEVHYIGEVFPFSPCAAESCATEEMAALTEEQKAEIALMFAPGNAMSRKINKYDDQDRLIESTVTMMGMEAGRQIFRYDEAGNKSEEIVYYNQGEFESRAVFTREFDERGNWTKEIVTGETKGDEQRETTQPVNITLRKITYFDVEN